MAIFKCKMCGGELSFNPGDSIGTCDYCGAQQTLPKVTDENIQALFNRANVLRMKAEFDKAAEVYEKILQNNGTEAEAYWGLILCKYGIEYVEDPTTFKRIPTCHRASYDAVTADDDYKMALQYADASQKAVYEAEAKTIDEIQKGIVALAQKEAPYDVFICYKETDESGKRTVDSVIANDIYYQLTQEGFKVFYAAITLESKLGQEYEPYIFSALNSARVMLSIGTKPEYFNAVWVKNEWSRFLKIMKKDRARMLIPCFKDMDAYELPEEFAHLQAQDMSKIGFINDLVRGIKKVIVKEDAKQAAVPAPQPVYAAAAVTAPVSGNIAALLERGNMALEDGEWEKADGFFEDVLNQDAKCSEAYLGKLLSKCKRSNVSSLTQYYISKYESSETENLEACEEAVSRIANAVSQYVVLDYLSDSEIIKQYEYDRTYASELSFRKQQKSQELTELAGEKLLSRAQQYATGETKNLIDKMMADITAALDSRIVAAQKDDNEQIASVKSSYEMHLNGADVKVGELYNNALARQEEAARQAKRKKIITAIVAAVTVAIIVVYMVVTKVVIPNNYYNNAVALMNSGKYEDAVNKFEALDGYKDSDSLKATAEISIIANASIGDNVVFGNYNGNTEWIVLAKEDGKILVISKYAIERRSYNTESTSITWEKCTLRSWLNEKYLTSAFSNDERSRIIEVSINNPDNSKYRTDGGNNTNDKVFLLSIDEVKKYFTRDSARKVTLSDGTSVWCWLRSPGSLSSLAAEVDGDGSVDEVGYNVRRELGAVRPALWIDISNL